MVCKRYTYTVSGNGPIPFDMLRYDSAWPHDQESAEKCAESFESARMTALRPAGGTRIIDLTSHYAPTEARWKSFGWQVTNIESRRL